MEAVIRGNLAADPELKAVGDTFKARLRVGVQGKKDEATVWVDAEVWDELARRAAKTLKKGHPVVGVGKWKAAEWKDPQGQLKRKMFAVLYSLGPDLARSGIDGDVRRVVADEQPPVVPVEVTKPDTSAADPFDEE